MANQKSSEILEEMIQLSVDVISICQKLSLPPAVISQITRSVTSIGANYSEAQDASSKKDFINKIYIAKKEAAETKYWLAIIAKLSGNPSDINVLSEKVQRFVMMLQKIVNTSKESKPQMANR
ncbi:MAG TPA: four helix bundle protein [Candidatus Saccharimonadales bacterium]|nr:four helix bundle protein [Candidatus Saccharimonadales bacterium]